jgi:hypothetical protein
MTARTFSSPLFFDAGASRMNLLRMVAGVDEIADADIVEFADPGGGDVTRELGVPFLQGMDEIHVEAAAFNVGLSSQVDAREAVFNSVAESHGNGIVVSLASPARVVKITIKYDEPVNPPATVRIAVRPATPAGSGFTFSPPIYAFPAYSAPGPMFGPVLAGMSVTDAGGGAKVLRLPPTLGSAWLVQIGTGTDDDGAAKLAPLPIVPEVTSVMIDAVPTNFQVTLAAADGDVTLWSRPGMMIRQPGSQQVSFLPMAQKQLSAQLQRSTSGAALTIPIKFHSDSESKVQVTGKTLSATYRVKPLGSDPAKLRLSGSWMPLVLTAPAGLESLEGSVNLTAKLQPRELNAASPEPSVAPPASGLRVTAATQAACAMPFAPLAGGAAGSVLSIASVRLRLEAADDSEVVMELRSDAAALPGPVLRPPTVTQVKKGFSDWLEFELDKPLPASTGGAPIWVCVRLNRGEIRWFADPALLFPAVISTNKGASWSQPATALGRADGLLTQLFHALPDPLDAPVIRVQYQSEILTANFAPSPIRKGAREFSAPAVELSQSLRTRLRNQSGTGRHPTTIQLFSRSVLDLTLDGASISYDPFQAGVAKGT